MADVVRASYGDGTARIFFIAGILALLSFFAIAFIKEKTLRTESGDEQLIAKLTATEEADIETGRVVLTNAVSPNVGSRR